MTRKTTLFLVVPALALSLSACGSSTTDPGAAPSMSSSMAMPSTSAPAAEPSSASPSTAAAPDAVVISITDFEFTVPDSVSPGATITIENADKQAHTVTSKTGGFDVKVDPGGTATLTAPSKPGTYPFVCSFHGNMSGTLVVK